METKFFKTFEDLIWYLWHVLNLEMRDIGGISVALSRSKYFYDHKRAEYFYELEIIKLESGSMVYPIQLNVTKPKTI